MLASTYGQPPSYWLDGLEEADRIRIDLAALAHLPRREEQKTVTLPGGRRMRKYY